jgi:hypothetical protein
MNKQQVFSPGTRVMVKVRDWGPNTPMKVYTLTGVIHSKVVAPSGYNVQLDKPHPFLGNVPLPFLEHSRVDLGGQTVVLQIIFVRAFDISAETEQDMRFVEEVCQFFGSLLFPKVTAVLPVESKIKISHILYFSPDGETKTLSQDLQTVLKNKDIDPSRLVVKYAHFYGFADRKPDVKEDDSLYFSSNRYAQIDLASGLLSWSDMKPNPPKPEIGHTLCCSISGKFNGNSESMDAWFIASPQLQLLAKLCTGQVKMSIDNAVEQLIVPENIHKMPILHEIQVSRYLYAGIWLLMNRKPIPEHYNMPKMRNPIGKADDMQPFHIWWPREVMSKKTSKHTK